MKKWFERFLKKISDANSESFANEKLDCCSLNRNDSSKKNRNSSNSNK